MEENGTQSPVDNEMGRLETCEEKSTIEVEVPSEEVAVKPKEDQEVKEERQVVTSVEEEDDLEDNERGDNVRDLLTTEDVSKVEEKSNEGSEAQVIVRQVGERNIKEELGKWPPEDNKLRKSAAESNRVSLPQSDITRRLRAKFEHKTEGKMLEKPAPVAQPSRRASDFGVPASDMCYVCNKRVYPMEKMEINKHILHKNCFKCSQCLSSLRLNNYTFSGDKLFCITHFKQIFLTKGNYDEGFGREQHKDKWTHKN